MNDLTICSVSFNNAEHLRLNFEATRMLNSNPDRIRWIITENTPADSNSDDTLWGDPRFSVLEGIETQPRPTYQHTLALSKALAQVTTRFVLVLDPDFFILQKEWASSLMDYVQERKLSFIGTPWNPKYSDKYRYFPTLHCFLADTSKIALEELDFRPIVENNRNEKNTEDRIDPEIYLPTDFWVRFLMRFSECRKRFRIHRDTGGRLYYRNRLTNDFQFECLTPVFRENASRRDSISLGGKLLQNILPDEFCRMPKNRYSYREAGFAEEDMWPEVPSSWDEFYWRNAPFGFHVRRNAEKESRDEAGELLTLRKRLQHLGLT